MIESVFKILIEKGLIKDIEVQASIPSKGKPASKGGSSLVWIINSRLTDNTIETLESSRGGPREWASLDRLNNWLSKQGVHNYQIIRAPIMPLQQQLIDYQ